MVAESRYFNQKLALSPQWPLSCSSWPYIKSSSSSSLAFHRANAGRLSRCLLGDFTACPLCTVPCALTQKHCHCPLCTVLNALAIVHSHTPQSSLWNTAQSVNISTSWLQWSSDIRRLMFVFAFTNTSLHRLQNTSDVDLYKLQKVCVHTDWKI